MEHSRVLWPSERSSRVCGCAGNERTLAPLPFLQEEGTGAILSSFVVGWCVDHALFLSYNLLICRCRRENPAVQDGLKVQRPGRHEVRNRKSNFEHSRPHCSIVLAVGWPHPRGSGYCSYFRQATSMNTSASNVEPLPAPKPSKNAAACCFRRSAHGFARAGCGHIPQTRESDREEFPLRSASRECLHESGREFFGRL
jgi:hypothetical protein